jgi:DNA-binding CsgD family transcriptional regulator
MQILLFLTLNLFSVGLLIVKERRQFNLWLAGYLSCYSLGFLVELIDPIPKITIVDKLIFAEVAARFLSAVSYRFTPFFYICSFISLSSIIKFDIKKYMYIFFGIPIVLFFVYDFFSITDSWVYCYIDYCNQFQFLTILTGIYLMLGIILIAIELYQNKNTIKKSLIKNIIPSILALSNIPLYYAIYLVPALKIGIHDTALATLVFGTYFNLIILIFANTTGFFGIKVQYIFLDDKFEEYNLKPIEKKIAVDILNDLSGEQSALKYNLALQTIKNHKNQIFKKLNVKNKNELINKFKK